MDEPSERACPPRRNGSEEMLSAGVGRRMPEPNWLWGSYIRTDWVRWAGSGVAWTRHTKKATCINGDHPWAASRWRRPFFAAPRLFKAAMCCCRLSDYSIMFTETVMQVTFSLFQYTLNRFMPTFHIGYLLMHFHSIFVLK